MRTSNRKQIVIGLTLVLALLVSPCLTAQEASPEAAPQPVTEPAGEPGTEGPESSGEMVEVVVEQPVEEVAEPVAEESVEPSDLQAFVTNGRQGVNYRRGTWHMPLIALEAGQEFLVIDRAGGRPNCDEHVLDASMLLLEP